MRVNVVDYWYSRVKCDGVGMLSDQLKHSMWTQTIYLSYDSVDCTTVTRKLKEKNVYIIKGIINNELRGVGIWIVKQVGVWVGLYLIVIVIPCLVS